MKRWLLPVPGLVVLLLAVGFCPGEDERSQAPPFATWRDPNSLTPGPDAWEAAGDSAQPGAEEGAASREDAAGPSFLAGTIFEQGGRHPAAAELYLFGPLETAPVRGAPYRGRSGEDGRFRIDGLPPGRYEVYARALEPLNGDPRSYLRPEPDLVALAGVEDARVILAPFATIVLRAVDARTGHLVPGVWEVRFPDEGESDR